MAVFFGKKDKNPPEVAAPVAKTQPTPPKIQSPPGSGSFPAVRPPQPTGLMPAPTMPGGNATTQLIPMPRTGMVGISSAGLTPTRPGASQSSRPPQRIVLPTLPGSKPSSTKPVPLGSV